MTWPAESLESLLASSASAGLLRLVCTNLRHNQVQQGATPPAPPDTLLRQIGLSGRGQLLAGIHSSSSR